MTGTLRRVEGLLRGGGGSPMCTLVGGTMAIFTILWWVLRR